MSWLTLKIVALFNQMFPFSEESRAVNLALKGDVEPFIQYFTQNEVKMTDISARRKASPSGRVVFENDMFFYVYIDGSWVGRMDLGLPYDQKMKLVDCMENAVFSNVPGTVAYEERHHE